MILEGLVTTLNSDGTVHLTPMGPVFQTESSSEFELRPFEGSTTLANLQRHPFGVLHVSDDVELFARSALGCLETLPEMRPAETIEGAILVDACRWYEFIVQVHEATPPRHRLVCQVQKQGRGRDFWGFHRARHAVIEAAILATRIDLLPEEQIREEFERLRSPVIKTAGEKELRVFAWLESQIDAGLAKRHESQDAR